MILDTLFIESLSNFVHGLSTAFFLYFGINLIFFRATNRPLFILGCLFAVGCPRLERLVIVYRYYRRFSILFYYSFIDRYVGVPLCALFLLEILSPGFATLRRVLLFELSLVLFTVVYIMTGFIRSLYVECRLYGGSLCIGSLVYNRAGEEV